MHFTDVFAALGLRRAHSTAIDTEALIARLNDGSDQEQRLSTAVARAVSGVLAAAVSLTDPSMIVIGGEWGTQESITAAVAEHFGQTPRPLPVSAATLPSPDLDGARTEAVESEHSWTTREGHPRNSPG
jgi:predicted NBD/HSP70 family sugar kinase